jgi:hypothetical protein
MESCDTVSSMQKIDNAIIRVYIADGYWETGVLWPYFENDQSEVHCPMFFRSDNCDFDPVSRCYVFRLAQLGESSTTRDVYVPERFVVGVAVRYGTEPSEPMQKVGYV